MNKLSQIETTPDFHHVDAWIFDLDNTLYPAASGLFGQVDLRMTQFVADLLGVGHEDARALQKTYYREHGTTLNGLMRLHGVDPEVYLGYVHDIDLSPLAGDGRLAAGLARVDGKRFVFTNGCRKHAARVLERPVSLALLSMRSGTSAPSAFGPSRIRPRITRSLPGRASTPRAPRCSRTPRATSFRRTRSA
jgi:hypothetical protein